MQGRSGELLQKSHDAYVEESNRPHDHDEPQEMQNHHERPPPLTECYCFAELFRRWLEVVNEGSDGSFRHGILRRCDGLAGPNFRMADVAPRVTGPRHEGHRQERKKQNG